MFSQAVSKQVSLYTSDQYSYAVHPAWNSLCAAFITRYLGSLETLENGGAGSCVGHYKEGLL